MAPIANIFFNFSMPSRPVVPMALLAAAAWLSSPALPRLSAAGAQVVPDTAYLEPGRAERLDLYLPERAPEDPPSPAIVWIPATGGGKGDAQARNLCGCLAAAGYVCASVDYRRGPDAWPASLLDCKNAVRFLRAHAAQYHVDADRIAAMGGSAGGRLALSVGLTAGDAAPEPPAPYPGIPDSVWAVGVFCGPDGSPVERSPSLASRVRPDSPPVLIVLGNAGPEAGELEQALSRNGVPHEVVLRYTGDTAVVLGFLRQYFGTPEHGLPVAPPSPSPRAQIDLDGTWRFYPADNVHGPETGFDDAGWQSVAVPHTWNALDGQDGGNNYRRGVGWYRRHVRLDPALAGKRLYLQFDGASLAADVYVNGIHVGAHKGGFSRFRLDATDALAPGRDNLISVRVDNGSLGIPPVSADFTFFGGIYRPVSLVATGQIQVSATDYGSPGVYLDQDEVTAQEANLTVRTEVESYADKKSEVEVRAHLLDAAGREVAGAGNRGWMNGGDGLEERQHLFLRHPHLWNGKADPYLYALRVDIIADKVLVDSVTQAVGLRSFRVDPDRGFFLNGSHIDLHGVSRHQDRIDKGWAISPADEAEDFDLVRELGCTAVRVAHYQQSDTWYQRFDRAGIVAWAEIPFVEDALPAPEFLDSAKQQLRELIRQNYNHPSICFWGVGNEARGDPADGVIAALADVARAQDQTRLSTYASNAKEDDPKNWHTEVVGFNHYAGWYSGEFTDLPAWLDQVHRLHPRSAFAISEYGAGASIYEHEEPPRRPAHAGPFHPEEYQSRLHEASWLALSARPYVWGKFIWNLADFASDKRSEGDHAGRNDKGLVTYDRRIRKDAFYWYKANWSDEPVVWIASRRFLERRKPLTEVTVYSNAPAVELAVDGASRGVLRSPDRIFRWPAVALHPGENHIAATARFDNLSFTDACTWLCRPSEPRRAGPAPPATAR